MTGTIRIHHADTHWPIESHPFDGIEQRRAIWDEVCIRLRNVYYVVEDWTEWDPIEIYEDKIKHVYPVINNTKYGIYKYWVAGCTNRKLPYLGSFPFTAAGKLQAAQAVQDYINNQNQIK